jgi:hypothetical protein
LNKNYSTCSDLSYTFNDAEVNQPAGLWGVNNGINSINQTYLNFQYKRQPSNVKTRYIEFSCNMSTLQYEIFPMMTSFHDEYVIRYLNLNKDPLFTHVFEVNYTKYKIYIIYRYIYFCLYFLLMMMFSV